MSWLHRQPHETAAHIADLVRKNRMDEKQKIPALKPQGLSAVAHFLQQSSTSWRFHNHPKQTHCWETFHSQSTMLPLVSAVHPNRLLFVWFAITKHKPRGFLSAVIYWYPWGSRVSMRKESPSWWVSLCLPQEACSCEAIPFYYGALLSPVMPIRLILTSPKTARACQFLRVFYFPHPKGVSFINVL